MDYYNKKLYLAKVDKNDKVIGKVERWEAHRKGILHRCFTVCLFYKNQAILQHRKHPAFDSFIDLTCSSHPIFKGEKLQDTKEAVIEALEREWKTGKSKFQSSKLKYVGKCYYKAEDPNSEFKEHEVCYFYTGEIKAIPQPNLDFAYGFSLVDLKTLKNPKFPLKPSFALWVKHCLDLL